MQNKNRQRSKDETIFFFFLDIWMRSDQFISNYSSNTAYGFWSWISRKKKMVLTDSESSYQYSKVHNDIYFIRA